jgi:hypothetical protein
VKGKQEREKGGERERENALLYIEAIHCRAYIMMLNGAPQNGVKGLSVQCCSQMRVHQPDWEVDQLVI